MQTQKTPQHTNLIDLTLSTPRKQTSGKRPRANTSPTIIDLKNVFTSPIRRPAQRVRVKSRSTSPEIQCLTTPLLIPMGQCGLAAPSGDQDFVEIFSSPSPPMINCNF